MNDEITIRLSIRSFIDKEWIESFFLQQGLDWFAKGLFFQEFLIRVGNKKQAIDFLDTIRLVLLFGK